MKKLLAVLLAFAMLFALTACNSNSIVGKWQWEMTIDGEMIGIEGFEGEFAMLMIFAFDEDGGYCVYVDKDALEESLADFEADLVEYMVQELGEGSRKYAENFVSNMKLSESIVEQDMDVEGEYEIDGDYLIMTPDDEDEEEEEYEFELDGDELTLIGESESFAEMLEMLGEDDIVLKRA